MARHAKPKRRRARKLLCLLLAAVLLISSGGLAWHYRAAIRKRLFPEKNEPVLTELTAPDGVEAEMIRIASDGDVLKLDYVMPGLDTFSMYTVIRSLQSGKVLSATDCGTSDFSTGLVNGGFYVAESAEKQVRFYDHRGTLQRTQSLPSAAAAGMLSVTPDGRYICYGDAKEARIRLLDTVAGVRLHRLSGLFGCAGRQVLSAGRSKHAAHHRCRCRHLSADFGEACPTAGERIRLCFSDRQRL